MTKSRFFNGKKYERSGDWNGKMNAVTEAKALRKLGHHARVVLKKKANWKKGHPDIWTVYWRKKQ